ncbi:MAG: SMP-30/gluconolactonase/LRE family protein, partial [Flavobacteriales bacterium]
MRTTFLFLIIYIVPFLGLSQKKSNNEGFKKMWSTEKALDVPESVKWNKEKDIYYISNVNGKPLKKNGKGFISKLKPNGKIKKKKWITGLNAPKGMGIHDGKLYVTDIDRLVKIDINEGQIIATYKVKNAEFLNDIDIDNKGTVYISDMSKNVIYYLNEGNIKKWHDGSELNEPNGLKVKNGRLYVGMKNKIISFNIDKGSKNVNLEANETNKV